MARIKIETLNASILNVYFKEFLFHSTLLASTKTGLRSKSLIFVKKWYFWQKKLLETNGNQSLPIVSNFAWANSAIGVFILPSALQLNSIPNVGKKNYANANGFNSNMWLWQSFDHITIENLSFHKTTFITQITKRVQKIVLSHEGPNNQTCHLFDIHYQCHVSGKITVA